MDDYTALSDDLLEDFIESGNCQEKQSSKDIEGTNFKILSRICGKIKGLRSWNFTELCSFRSSKILTQSFQTR